MSEPRVVLASASPRRAELLAAILPSFEVLPSNVPEDIDMSNPDAAAIDLALRKARAVAATLPAGCIVIGSDTVVHDGARDFGKPADAADAVETLRALRGRSHQVATGLAVVTNGRAFTSCSVSDVEITALSDGAIETYVASGRPMDKAGAYAIQDEDVPTVASFRGCYCGVMGLPLWSLRRLLHEAGLETPPPSGALPRCASCDERDE